MTETMKINGYKIIFREMTPLDFWEGVSTVDDYFNEMKQYGVDDYLMSIDKFSAAINSLIKMRVDLSEICRYGFVKNFNLTKLDSYDCENIFIFKILNNGTTYFVSVDSE